MTVGAKYITNLKDLRKANNLTQQQLGQKLRKPVDITVVSRWERGVVQPSADNFMELAHVLQVHPNQIFFTRIKTDKSGLNDSPEKVRA